MLTRRSKSNTRRNNHVRESWPCCAKHVLTPLFRYRRAQRSKSRLRRGKDSGGLTHSFFACCCCSLKAFVRRIASCLLLSMRAWTSVISAEDFRLAPTENGDSFKSASSASNGCRKCIISFCGGGVEVSCDGRGFEEEGVDGSVSKHHGGFVESLCWRKKRSHIAGSTRLRWKRFGKRFLREWGAWRRIGKRQSEKDELVKVYIEKVLERDSWENEEDEVE